MTAVNENPSRRQVLTAAGVGLAAPAAALTPAPETGEALGRARRLIFENIANGVPVPKVMAAFRRSEAEVWREVEFVGRKIREARFRAQMPPVEHQGLQAIRFNRKVLLETLRQLTDRYLSSELLMPKIGVQGLDTPAIIGEAVQRVKGRVAP